MLKEQEEAIEILEHIKKEFKGSTKAPNINTRNTATIKIQAIETVLSMLKEKSAEIEQKKTELAEKNAEIERLNRQIDLMAEEINETDRGYTDYCEMKIECDRNCKDCIKRYYERKATNNG